MLKRIKSNETKLNKITKVVDKLEQALDSFETVQQDLIDLNEYYGSDLWFADKEAFEQGKINGNNEITNIKAGVLSEDAVWNLDERISELKARMKEM